MAETDNLIQDDEDVTGVGGVSDVANRQMKAAHSSFGLHRFVGNSSVASASTVTPPDDENSFTITGTTTMAGFANKDANFPGMLIIVKFTSALTLTHNGTSFIMPNSVDYEVGAGEIITFQELTAGNYRFASSSHSTELSGGNPIINGGLNVWQRGTSFTANGYTADRLKIAIGGGMAATISRQAGPPEHEYCIRAQRDNADTVANNLSLISVLETADSKRFAGEIVTFSFKARKGTDYSAASNFLRSDVITGTGTDESSAGAISGAWTGYAIASQNNTLSGSWQTFTQTHTVASGATQIGIQFNGLTVGTAGAADYYEIAGIQLIEWSATSSNFMYESKADTADKCNRYYYQSATGDTGGLLAFSGDVTNLSSYWAHFELPSIMRTTPTVVGTNVAVLSFAAATGTFSATAYGVREQRNATATATGYFRTAITADAEL